MFTVYFRYLCLLELICEHQPKMQDAKRAKSELIAFSKDHGHKIAAFYVENESGATLTRPQLMQLIDDAHDGDVILVEQIDRLARLNQADWDTLRRMLSEKSWQSYQKSCRHHILRFNLRAALNL